MKVLIVAGSGRVCQKYARYLLSKIKIKGVKSTDFIYCYSQETAKSVPRESVFVKVPFDYHESHYQIDNSFLCERELLIRSNGEIEEHQVQKYLKQ